MTDAGSSSLRFEVSGEVSPLIAELAEHRVASLTSRQPSLEEIFLDHYDSSDGKVGGSVLLRRAFRDARTRTLAFAYLFAGVSYIQPVSDHPRIPRWASGLAFAHSFAYDKAVVLFYGNAYDLLRVGGYTA